MAKVLGHANWTDPDRRQSINPAVYTKLSRGWFHRRTAWAANPPALYPLIHTRRVVMDLIERRSEDFYDGENTQPGWGLDVTMHGKTVDDAQPTIICSSTSSRCRRNAKNILGREKIPVDDRGIGFEVYADPVIFYAGSSSEPSHGFREVCDYDRCNSPQPLQSFSNGFSIEIGSQMCTAGGIVIVGGTAYLLTVAHAFESSALGPSPSMFDIVPRDTRPSIKNAGALWEKRSLHRRHGRRNFDWALCSVDTSRIAVTNGFVSPDGANIYPTQITRDFVVGTSVLVATGTKGLVHGRIMSDDSLVALPGSRVFQSMCSLVLEHALVVGDSGSWIFDAETGALYGHVIAGKTSGKHVYFVTAADIFTDIREQVQENVMLPDVCPADVTYSGLSKEDNPDMRRSSLFDLYSKTSIISSKRHPYLIWGFYPLLIVYLTLCGLMTFATYPPCQMEEILPTSRIPLYRIWDNRTDVANEDMGDPAQLASSTMKYWARILYNFSCSSVQEHTFSVDYSTFTLDAVWSADLQLWSMNYKTSFYDNESSALSGQPLFQFSCETDYVENGLPPDLYLDKYLFIEHSSYIFKKGWLRDASSTHFTPAPKSSWLSGTTPASMTRSGPSVIVSFFFTIFVCTWTSIRLNIPGQEGGATLRKAKWILVGLFSPELIVYMAWSERQAASKLAKAVNSFHGHTTHSASRKFVRSFTKVASSGQKETEGGNTSISTARVPWTVTHGFYALMGGFAFETPEPDLKQSFMPGQTTERWTLTSTAITYLSSLPNDSAYISDIKHEEIRDKSKADVLTKGVVALQVTWALLQFAMRAFRSLPARKLEVLTLEYLICAGITYMFWMDKPLDVQTPTLIRKATLWPLRALTWMSRTPYPENCSHGSYWRREQNSNQGLYEYTEGDFIEDATIYGEEVREIPDTDLRPRDSNGNIVCSVKLCPGDTLYGTGFRIGSSLPINRFLGIWRPPMQMTSVELNPVDVARWRLAWQAYRQTSYMSFDERRTFLTESLVTRCKNWPPPAFAFADESGGITAVVVMALAMLASSGFHVLAWNSESPPAFEQLVWRFATIVEISVSLVVLLLSGIVHGFPGIQNRSWTRRFNTNYWILTPAIALRVASRVFLLVEAFVSLRSAPPGVYEAVDWSEFIPHF